MGERRGVLVRARCACWWRPVAASVGRRQGRGCGVSFALGQRVLYT